MFVLADGITFQIGEHAWTVDGHFLLYLLIAAIIGLIAETIVGWRVPFGIVGAIIVSLLGIWLTTQVIDIRGISVNGQDDIYLFGVPLIRALIGGILFVALWHLIAAGLFRSRYRRSYRTTA